MAESHGVLSNHAAPLGGESPGVTEGGSDREYEWTRYAVLSGVVGAFIVAVVFLVADLLAGRPALWTPAVLGSALFLGESVGSDVGLQPMTRLPIVFGYTLMHGAVFIGFGALIASGRLTRERSREWTIRSAMLTALLVFIGLEITFAALGWVVGSNLDLATRLGTGWIAVANALAALGMSGTIGWAARRLSR